MPWTGNSGGYSCHRPAVLSRSSSRSVVTSLGFGRSSMSFRPFAICAPSSLAMRSRLQRRVARRAPSRRSPVVIARPTTRPRRRTQSPRLGRSTLRCSSQVITIGETRVHRLGRVGERPAGARAGAKLPAGDCSSVTAKFRRPHRYGLHCRPERRFGLHADGRRVSPKARP
jgi:hypothetical protein